MVLTLQAEVLLDAHAEHGEGPVWDGRAGRLLWVNISAQEVHQLDPSMGEDRVYRLPGRPGAVAVRARGGLVVAVEHGFATLDLESSAVSHLVDVESESAGNRMNDGKCDAAGRFWAGTMCLDEDKPTGALYRLDPDGSARAVLPGATVSNGLAWTADNRTLYYIDSPTHGVDAFDFDLATGRLANRRRVVDVPAGEGVPDGMTLDAEGCLWVAHWGGYGAYRYMPDGRLDRVVRVPAQFSSSVTFGGAGLDELYITSAAHPVPVEQRAAQPHAGAVFACRPGVAGLPAHEFEG